MIWVGSAIFDSTESADAMLSARKNTQAITTARKVRSNAAMSAVRAKLVNYFCADKPGGSDHLMLWIGAPAVTTADESTGPALALANDVSGDEEGAQKDDNGVIDAIAREFKGQRWDADQSAWK